MISFKFPASGSLPVIFISLVKSLCLGEAKMAATTINVVNSFSTIVPSYLLFFKKTVSKTRL